MENRPQLPWEIVEKILKFQSTKDLKNCRLVSYNWLCIIDVYVGVALKLNAKNKAKVFSSSLIRSCTSLKIYKSAGLLNWYVCYFSPMNLKSVEILENILCDNWRLLLTQCKAIQFLTITAHILSCNKSTKLLFRKENTFDFGSEITEKIDHYSLRRLSFKVPSVRLEDNREDYVSMANMLNSLGNIPHLRQIIIVTLLGSKPPHDNVLKTSILSLMQRNAGISSFGFMDMYSPCQEMKLWDTFLENKLSCLAWHNLSNNQSWTSVLERMLNASTLYYGTVNDHQGWNVFCTLIANMSRESRDFTALFLKVCDSGRQVHWELDCNRILQAFPRLKNFSLRQMFFTGEWDSTRILDPSLQNFNMLSNQNILIEYLDISVQLSEANLTTIFGIPKLEKLHIQFQKSATELKEQHFVQIRTHPKLKLILWQKTFQAKWNHRFDEGDLYDKWESVDIKSNTKSILWYLYGDKRILVAKDGVFNVKSWKEITHAYALFHKERITDNDRVRIQEDH